MARAFALLFFLANLLALNCQEEGTENSTGDYTSNEGKPRYSFSYGVSDARTGDIKTVWESKEGDTVKGHYSVLEPDGSMRTVEYSAGPKTGFKAVVNNENSHSEEPQGLSIMEDKAMRDYGKYYDFSEDGDEDNYESKRTKHPLDSLFKDYAIRKKLKYPYDLEPSEYTHSISIKHPRDESSDSEAHSHVGYSFDPNCKTKTRKESNENKDNLYANIVDLEMSKTKNPIFSIDSYKEPYDKHTDSSNYDFEKYKPYSSSFKGSKYDDKDMKPPFPTKYTFPTPPDLHPPEKYYPDEMPQRPKKKNKPYKLPEFFPSDDLDDYILVPKKKYKLTRVKESDYRPESDDESDRPPYGSSSDDSQDDRYGPTRGNGQKEVIRKVVKKRRPPVINLLDIFDI